MNCNASATRTTYPRFGSSRGKLAHGHCRKLRALAWRTYTASVSMVLWWLNMQAENSALRKYAELSHGERRDSPLYEVLEKEMVDFAHRFDPQWFHINPQEAERSPFGGVIASGIYILALWRRIDHAMNGDIAYRCGVALERVLFRAPVYPGDRVTLRSEIVGLRLAADPTYGIATMHYAMTNQDGAEVLTLRAVNMVYC